MTTRLLLILLALHQTSYQELFAGQGEASARRIKSGVNFREPAREYQTVALGGWSFEVETQLLTDEPNVADKALKRLRENLDRAFQALPKAAHPALLELKWFVLYGPKSRGGGYDNGLAYFAKDAPKFRDHLDERWSRCIVIYCAENYTKLSDLWALKSVVHELGHAHHKENWAENQEDILAAWRNAVDKKLYRNVRDDQGGVIPQAYALANHLEYFAELTAIYFARGNYAPFNRDELKTYDPAGHAMIEKMWGLSKDEPPPLAIRRANGGSVFSPDSTR
jgi:hypothetical protein